MIFSVYFENDLHKSKKERLFYHIYTLHQEIDNLTLDTRYHKFKYYKYLHMYL